MSTVFRIITIIIGVMVFFSVIYMLVKRKLNETNSILWLFIGFVTLIIGCFPLLIGELANLVGVENPLNLLFFISTILLLLIAFKSSTEISMVESKINEIAITLSILKEENKILTDKLNSIINNSPDIGEESTDK